MYRHMDEACGIFGFALVVAGLFTLGAQDYALSMGAAPALMVSGFLFILFGLLFAFLESLLKPKTKAPITPL